MPLDQLLPAPSAMHVHANTIQNAREAPLLCSLQCVDASLHPLKIAEEDHVDDARSQHRYAQSCT